MELLFFHFITLIKRLYILFGNKEAPKKCLFSPKTLRYIQRRLFMPRTNYINHLQRWWIVLKVFPFVNCVSLQEKPNTHLKKNQMENILAVEPITHKLIHNQLVT